MNFIILLTYQITLSPSRIMMNKVIRVCLESQGGSRQYRGLLRRDLYF
jgi:hypothetical protein